MDEAQEPSKPAVTALIVSHNQARALRRCLAALNASQARDKLEILVVDNGSRDESPGLDAEFPGTTFLRLPKNFGRAKAWNIGIRTAAAEYVLFLSPAVEVMPETVARLAALLDGAADAVAVCPLLVDEEGKPVSGARALATPAELFERWKKDEEPDWKPVAIEGGPAEVEWTSMEAMLARKYFIRGLNFFDERYGDTGVDAELCYQIRRAQRKVLVVGEARAVRHRLEEAPKSVGARAARSADRLAAVTAYAGKHYGMMAGLGWRLRGILICFINLLMFREVGYQVQRLLAVGGGAKIDGSQGGE